MQVGVSKRAVDGVDADMVSGFEKVYIGEFAFSAGVKLCPLVVVVFGQEFSGVLNIVLLAGRRNSLGGSADSADGGEHFIISHAVGRCGCSAGLAALVGVLVIVGVGFSAAIFSKRSLAGEVGDEMKESVAHDEGDYHVDGICFCEHITKRSHWRKVGEWW